jgi:adenylosuccinate synthase
VPGWQESTLGIDKFDDLPKAAQDYINNIEQSVGAKVAMISTGPNRHETIVLDHPFQ